MPVIAISVGVRQWRDLFRQLANPGERSLDGTLPPSVEGRPAEPFGIGLQGERCTELRELYGILKVLAEVRDPPWFSRN